jgi:hypothetical protein
VKSNKKEKKTNFFYSITRREHKNDYFTENIWVLQFTKTRNIIRCAVMVDKISI